MPVEGFVHPALALGALLAAVPLIIHLLNRQRHRPLRWAAMRFVELAYRRTRRRARLENLLLLLLRMAAVALLAFAVARPFTGRGSPLAPLTESRRDLVLLIDGSASTGYREGVESVYESVLARARELLSSLEGTRGDRVRLYVAAATPRLLSGRSPEDALAALSTLSAPADEALDLGALLSEIASVAESDAAGVGESALEVRLLTDLQRNSFLPAPDRVSSDRVSSDGVDGEPPGPGAAEAGGPAATLRRSLDRLDELGIEVVVEDLGPGALSPPNLGIEKLGPAGDALAPGLPVEIAVDVRNHGSQGRSAVRVALEVDGERLPSRKLDLPASARARAIFSVVFPEGGHHALAASLEGDRLSADDSRVEIVHVPPTIRVLFVNGDPHDEIDRDEVGTWRAALEPPDDGAVGSGYAPFATRTITANAFRASDLDLAETDVLVLANVPSLSNESVEALERFVASGAALIVALGDRVADPATIDSWNARLWRADRTGLLPARLLGAVEVASRRDAYFRIASFEELDPALSFFADERWRPLLTEVPIYAFVASHPDEGSRVLARLDDVDRSPLLVQRDYDRGRVLLWTSSIDADWNRIPESPATLVPLVHELVRDAGVGRVAPRNAPVGGTLICEVESFPRSPAVLKPDGARLPLDGEPSSVAEGVWQLPPVASADQAGLWRIELEGARDEIFAVQLDPDEGDLTRLGPDELEADHPAWRIHRRNDGEAGGEKEDPERGELWRWLAGLALATLVAETLWAAWIGRRRGVA